MLAANLFALATAAGAQVAPPAAGPAAPAPFVVLPAPVAVPSWQAAGSDIPADPAWRTGTLANGVRYAVRRHASPPGSIAIRVRIDAGGLYGDDRQAGWGHIVEHMTFRGTAHYGDGEGSRIWQRLGASFGVDSNAFTSPRATTYVLDLPKADAESYRLAMDVVAEMVQSARIDSAALAVEKRVVLAERAARFSPLATKVEDANRAESWVGTKMARYPMIGTPATIAAADAASLRAWYKRWYRPERAVVVVAGDADPALLEAVVRDTFGGWRAEGPKPAEPDYGAPSTPAHAAYVVADPQAPNADEIVWITPHDEGPWTIARQQRQYLDWVADRVLRRRLATAVQAGGALLSAGVTRAQQRHIDDRYGITLIAKPGQTRAAYDQVFAILNDLKANPPSQAEVDEQVIDLQGGLRRQVDEATTAKSALLANIFVNDVDGGDVTAARRFYLALFVAQKPAITPDAVRRALAATIAPDPRLIHLTSTPSGSPGDDAAALAADLAAARQVAAGHQPAIRTVSLAELPPLGAPGTVAARSTIADLGIERVRFANGVTLDYKRTPFERDAIRLRVMVGHGVLDRPVGDPGLFWTASALGGAGFGPYTLDELTKLTAGRRIGFSFGGGALGLQMQSATGRRDVADALRLMVAGLTQMRYADGPVERLRATSSATYQTLYGQPGSVLSSFGARWFYGGDGRFQGVAGEAEIARLTPADFRRFWSDQLARGPIRIVAVGDLDGDELVSAVAQTFGTLPPRDDAPPAAAALAVTARPPPTGVPVLHHRGDPDQATVARVYPTPGGQPDIALSRTLSLATTIIEARLTEEFRERDGGTYSPFASRGSSTRLPGWGDVVVGTQLKVARIAGFQAALDRITADLATTGPDADALARAKSTQIAAIERSRSDNGYWLAALSDDLADPRDTDSIRTAASGRQAVTADDIRAAAARWLTPANSFSVVVLPTAPPAAPARAGRRAAAQRR